MIQTLSRPEVRLGMIVFAAVTVVALVAGAVLRGGPEGARMPGRELAIAVVAPVEPEVEPGGTMDVGALNDGFDRAALERRTEVPPYDALPEPAWVGDETLGDDLSRKPVPKALPVHEVRYAEDPASAPQGASDPLADGSRMFGFDRPRPDYAAERALRGHRLDALSSEGVASIPSSSE